MSNKKLTEKQKECLREFVGRKCEECHRHEKIVGKLTAHRVKRGCQGGLYELRNIKMICSYPGEIGGKVSCHNAFHAGEFR